MPCCELCLLLTMAHIKGRVEFFICYTGEYCKLLLYEVFNCCVMFQNVDDVDKENISDPVQVPLYAREIFQYYKDREVNVCKKNNNNCL